MNEIDVVTETIPAEPITAEPITAEPIAAEPIAAESIVAEPVPAEPVAAEPVVAEPAPSEVAEPEPTPTKTGKKKSLKIIIPILIAAIVALIAAGGILTIFLLKGVTGISDSAVKEHASVLMFYSKTQNTNVGTLYYQTEGGQEIEIDTNVQNGLFMLMPQTQRIYYADEDYTLYTCTPGGVKEKLVEHVNFYSLYFSEDEETYIFTATKNEQTVLYRNTIDGEKKKINSSVMSAPALSPDGNTVYYCDEDWDLFAWNAETDTEEKIASDTSVINAEDNAYVYNVYNEKKEKSYTYYKLAHMEDSCKTDFIGYCQWGQDAHILVGLVDTYYDEDIECSVGDLYIFFSDEKNSVRIASDVQENFHLSYDGRTLYFIDEGGDFYQKEIPEITENSAKNPDKIKKQLSEAKNINLADNIESFYVSPNGKHALSLDDDSNLYVHIEGEEKAKVGTEVDTMFIFDDRFVFLTEDDELYLNNKYTKAENIKEENVLLAEGVTSVSTTPYGQKIFYALNSGKIMLLSEGTKPKEFIEDASKYDEIKHNSNWYEESIYRKVLTMEDLAGYYYVESEECLLKISEAGNVEYYYIGEPNYATVEMDYCIDKYSSSLIFSEEHYYTFVRDIQGQKSLKNYSNTEYLLTELTEEDFNAEVEKQKKAEEERLAKEKRRQELEEKGRRYYRNGYYVSTTDTLYSSASHSASTTMKYTSSGNKYIYDYKVSEDADALWLKVYCRDESGYSSYYWVLAK